MRLPARLLIGLLALFALAGCNPNKPRATVINTPEPSAPTARPGTQPGTAPQTGSVPAMGANEQMALGNPSGAGTSDPNNALLEKPQFALSYNDGLGIPNWVSWRLSAQDMGSVDRGNFRPDPDLPEGFTRITPRDYTRSGYDRGHMCPSADRTATTEDNDATMLMTNIVPQASGNNQGPWKELEEYCRELAREGDELYIVAGPIGVKRKIGRGRVAVPLATWKAILALPEQPGNDLARINENTRVIAVMMPNVDSIQNREWQSFRVSVDDIEQKTGFDLFSGIPKPIQDDLESRVDSRQ